MIKFRVSFDTIHVSYDENGEKNDYSLKLGAKKLERINELLWRSLSSNNRTSQMVNYHNDQDGLMVRCNPDGNIHIELWDSNNPKRSVVLPTDQKMYLMSALENR